MKKLTLSVEQKGYLLLMIQYYFPESNWQWSNQQGYCGIYASEESKIFIWGGSNPHNSFPKFTHWFEACMMSIFPKVCNPMNAEHLADFYYVILIFNNSTSEVFKELSDRFKHPVDFLYEHHNELIKNK